LSAKKILDVTDDLTQWIVLSRTQSLYQNIVTIKGPIKVIRPIILPTLQIICSNLDPFFEIIVEIINKIKPIGQGQKR